MVIFRMQKKREYENKKETEISNFDMLFFFFMGRPSPPDLFTSRFALHTLRFVQNLDVNKSVAEPPTVGTAIVFIPYPTTLLETDVDIFVFMHPRSFFKLCFLICWKVCFFAPLNH